MPDELSEAEHEAMVAATGIRYETQRVHFEQGWLAARDYFLSVLKHEAEDAGMLQLEVDAGLERERVLREALAAVPASPGGEEREAMIDAAVREALRISRLSPAGAEAEREGLEDHAHWLVRLIIDAVLAAPASSEGVCPVCAEQGSHLPRHVHTPQSAAPSVDPRTVLIAPSVKLYIPKFNEGRATGYCVQCGKRLREHRGGRLRCPTEPACAGPGSAMVRGLS